MYKQIIYVSLLGIRNHRAKKLRRTNNKRKKNDYFAYSERLPHLFFIITMCLYRIRCNVCYNYYLLSFCVIINNMCFDVLVVAIMKFFVSIKFLLRLRCSSRLILSSLLWQRYSEIATFIYLF